MSNPGGAPGSNLNSGPVKFSKKAGVIDTSELIEKQARYDADVAMTESKEDRDAGILKKWWSRTWKHNLAEPYYRQKKYLESLKKINESRNRFVNEEGSTKKGTDDANDVIINRFIDDRKADMRRDGEKASTIVGNAQINKLIKDFATGAIDEATFNNQKKTVLSGVNSDYSKNEQLYVDNLLKVAQEIKDAANHGEKLADFDVDVEVTLGKAKDTIKTEAHLSKFNKVWDKFKNCKPLGFPIGAMFANEATASLIGAGVYAAITKLGTSALRSKVAKWFTFGGTALVSGLIAARNERVRMDKDRAFDSIERVKGKKFEADAKRRNEMESSTYKTRGAKEIISNLSIDLSKIKSGNATPAELQNALKNLADIESRIRLGDVKKIDLVSYSRFDQVDVESYKIDDLRAEMKVALRNQNLNFDQELSSFAKQQGDELVSGGGGIEAQDAIFKKGKRKAVWGKFWKTAVIGAGVGLVAQEVVNIFPGQTDGIVSEIGKHTKSLFKGEGWNGDHLGLHEKTTPLLSLARWMSGEHAHVPAADLHDFPLGHDTLKLPPGVNLYPNTDGTYAFVQNGQPIEGLDHLKLLDKDGNLDTDVLKQHGLGTTKIPTGGVVTGTAKEYFNAHSANMPKIHYGEWYENGTPKFDLNELRTYFGGVNGTGFDADGNIVLDVSKMTSDGSWHHLVDGNDKTVDAVAEMKAGKMQMLFALSKDTQHNPIPIKIGTDGKIIIPKDSECFKTMWTKDANGNAFFTGKFGSVAHQIGVGKDGQPTMGVFGTLTGNGVDTLPVDTTVSNIRIDMPNEMQVPLFAYAGNRQPLERGANPEKGPDITPTYYGLFSKNDLDREMGGARNSYFEKVINGKTIFVDKNGNPIERNKDREKQNIEGYLNKQDPTYLSEIRGFAGGMEKMHEKCRVSVIIPARFEEKNLENLLDQYSKQVDKKGNPVDKDIFEINIIINRKVGENPDNSVAVVEEWKRNNPGYHVNYIDIEFAKEKANVGTARKYITDLSLLRSTSRTKADGPLYIESEDADLTAVDKRTIAKLIEGFDEKPHLDILRGIQDRQPELMQKNELLMFERRLWDFAEVFMRKEVYRPENMQGSSFIWNRVISGGWNTAYTAESYAEIGGYVPDLIGEDMKIGQKISLLRGHNDANDNAIINTKTAETSGLRSNSSPRRFIDAMTRKISPYDDFENQSLKDKTIDELLDGVKQYEKASEAHRGNYENAMNILKNFIAKEMKQPEASDVFFRVLWAMGLKKDDYIVMPDNSIKLTDKGMPTIMSLFEKYKTEKRYEKGYKRQNSTIKS